MTIHLTSGTLDSNDNLDGWVITSHIAIIEGVEDIPLRKGDRITITGDLYRSGELLGNIA